MRYVAAYLLSVLGGNESPAESDVKKILSSVGIDADAACLKKVIAELKGKSLEEVIAAGQTKLAAMPTASAPAAAAAAPAVSGTKAEEKAADKKKEEPKEEEEEDEDMGFGLFD